MKKSIKIVIMCIGLFLLGIGLGMDLGNSEKESSPYKISGMVLSLIASLTLVKKIRRNEK